MGVAQGNNRMMTPATRARSDMNWRMPVMLRVTSDTTPCRINQRLSKSMPRFLVSFLGGLSSSS